MPHNLPRRRLDGFTPLAARIRLCDGRAESLGETGDDGVVVAGEIVKLDGFEGTVGFGGVVRGGGEDVGIEGLGGSEFEEGCEVLDDAAL